MIVVQVPRLGRGVVVVRPVRCFPANATGPTRFESLSPHWRRSGVGWWVPSWSNPEAPEQRVLEAGTRLGDYGAVTGWAALCWARGRWFRGLAADGSRMPVCLATTTVRAWEDVVICKEKLRPADWSVVDGLPVTTPVRSVTFEMRYARSVREAVVWFEMAAYDDLVSIAELEEYLPYLTAWTGVQRVRDALLLVEENSWSPQETRLRLVWVLDAGLPVPLCNRPVFDLEGHHLGTPDLLDVEAAVVVQYDGPVHDDPDRRGADRAQDLRYLEAGLGVVRVTKEDMVDRHGLAVRLEEARAEGLAHPAPRGWTVEPPAWWVATHTVERRRALDAEQAARWLRYRAAS
jgi:hypothetical protein